MLGLPDQAEQDQGGRGSLQNAGGRKKLTGISGTGTVRIYNATSRLIQAEAQAPKNGQDLRHTLISNLDDPDNPSNQRISVTGVSFDDLTLADWEAAKPGQIEAPFTFEDFDVLDS